MSFSKIQERQYFIATLSATTLWPHVFPQDSTILQSGRRANFLLPYRHGECDTNFMSIVWQNYHCFLLQTLLQLHFDSCSVHPIINFMQMSTFVCFGGHRDIDLYYYVYFQQITCILSTSLYLKCNLSGFAQWCLLLDVASVIYITGRACGWLRSMQSAVCGLVRMTNPSKATTPSKQQVSSIYQLGFPLLYNPNIVTFYSLYFVHYSFHYFCMFYSWDTRPVVKSSFKSLKARGPLLTMYNV